MRIERAHVVIGGTLVLVVAATGLLFLFDPFAASPTIPSSPEPFTFRKPIDEPPLLVSPRPADLVPQDAPEAPAIVAPYRGVVSTADGAPAARVRVLLATPAWAGDDSPDTVPWFDGTRLRVIARASTDSGGRFEIPAPAFASGMRPVFLVADAPERFVPERVLDPPRGVDVLVTLREGGVVTGIVRAEETRSPVADVSVRVRSRVLGAAGFEEDEDVVRTDDAGRFRVDHFVGEPFEFATRYPLDAAWRTHPVTMPAIEAGDAVEKDLLVSISPYFAGVVVDATTGEPVEGARVELAGPFARDARTGADGRFVLPRVEPLADGAALDNYVPGRARRLEVASERYLSASLRLLGDDPAATDLVIPLVRGVRVTGRVIDAVDGRPTDARVEIAFLGRALAMTVTGDDGRFAFDGLPPIRGASIEARVSGGGPGATLLDVDLASDRAFEITLDDPGTGSIAFDAGAVPVDSVRDPSVKSFVRLSVRKLDHPGATLDGGIAEGFRNLLGGEYLATRQLRDRVSGAIVSVGKGETVLVRAPEPDDPPRGAVAWVSGRALRSSGETAVDARVVFTSGGRALSAETCPWLHGAPGAFELEVPSGEPIEFVVVDVGSGAKKTVTLAALSPFGFVNVGDVVLSREEGE